MQTPDEWLADFESKVADLQRKATAFKHDIESATARLESEDGGVVVTVAPNGALTGLELPGSPALAAQIMTLVHQARQQAADHLASAFVPLGGDGEVRQQISAAEPSKPAATTAEDTDFSEGAVVYRERDSNW